ncbi:MAG: CoA transferase [Dehalococcoidia bacterium]
MPALEGMRVLDMTQYEAGTSCTQLLAWFGAEVVKVEPPTGDPGRGVGRGLDHTQYFMNYNANKRSIQLNLKDPRGRELLLKLAPHFDAFVENYGPGVIENLDIGYETMKAVNPRIIYGRIKGFGLSGPYSSFNSYDWVAQAAAGTFSVTGEPDGPPLHPGPTFGDTGTGMQMALAITAAYVQQQRTGEGQFIELSMQEAVTMFMRTLGLMNWGKEPAPRTGIHHGQGGVSTYPCKGDGPNDWVFIMPTTLPQWDALVTVLDRHDLLTDERFSDPMRMAEHKDELYDIVAEWTRQRTKHEAMEVLGAAGVPCSYVFDTMDLFTDPHLTEREFIQTVEHPAAGEVRLMRNPIRMEGVVPLRHSPLLGADTEAVLRDDLGLSEAEIAELLGSGAVASGAPVATT